MFDSKVSIPWGQRFCSPGRTPSTNLGWAKAGATRPMAQTAATRHPSRKLVTESHKFSRLCYSWPYNPCSGCCFYQIHSSPRRLESQLSLKSVYLFGGKGEFSQETSRALAASLSPSLRAHQLALLAGTWLWLREAALERNPKRLGRERGAGSAQRKAATWEHPRPRVLVSFCRADRVFSWSGLPPGLHCLWPGSVLASSGDAPGAEVPEEPKASPRVGAAQFSPLSRRI